MSSPKLRVGDWVEVLSKDEILATLDRNGRLDAMPFMPEMFEMCGKRLQVQARAHKTCDPVHGMEGRWMRNAVHLADSRCDGAEHDGCQGGCLIYWKTAWLKPVEGPGDESHVPAPVRPRKPALITEADLRKTIRTTGEDGELVYSCQATQVRAATVPISRWDPTQYIEDFTSGNVTISQMAKAFGFTVCNALATSGIGVGALVRWSYDAVQKVRGGVPYPKRHGKVRDGERTPNVKLDVQVGEIVRVRSYPEVLATLDSQWRNRGLYFDPEMAPFCGTEHKVLQRVERIIHEGSGKMLTFKNPALILDGVVCQARYAKHRRFCPRAYYQYCREAWVERVDSPAPAPQTSR